LATKKNCYLRPLHIEGVENALSPFLSKHKMAIVSHAISVFVSTRQKFTERVLFVLYEDAGPGGVVAGGVGTELEMVTEMLREPLSPGISLPFIDLRAFC